MGIFGCKKEDLKDLSSSEWDRTIEDYLDNHGERHIKKYLDKKNALKYIKDNQKDYSFTFIPLENLNNYNLEDFEMCNLDESLFAIPRSLLQEGECDMRRAIYWEKLYYIKRNPIIGEFFNTHVLVMKKPKLLNKKVQNDR